MLKKKGTPTKAISKEQCASEYDKRALGIIQLNFTRSHDLLKSAAVSGQFPAGQQAYGGGKRMFVFTENGLMPTYRRGPTNGLPESASYSADDDPEGSTMSNESFDESQELMDLVNNDDDNRQYKFSSAKGRRNTKHLSPASSSISPSSIRSPNYSSNRSIPVTVSSADDYKSDPAKQSSLLYAQTPAPRKLSTSNLVKKRKHPNPLDISAAEGVELLQPDEYELCTNLRIQPSVYFHARDTLVENGKTRGFYKKSAAQKMLRIDVNKTGKLYDFFYSKGWLPTSADYL